MIIKWCLITRRELALWTFEGLYSMFFAHVSEDYTRTFTKVITVLAEEPKFITDQFLLRVFDFTFRNNSLCQESLPFESTIFTITPNMIQKRSFVWRTEITFFASKFLAPCSFTMWPYTCPLLWHLKLQTGHL